MIYWVLKPFVKLAVIAFKYRVNMWSRQYNLNGHHHLPQPTVLYLLIS